MSRVPARAGSPRPISSLTGIRFCAALWVVLSHYVSYTSWPGFLATVAVNGPAGVSVFFVLSGFVLTYNYGSWFEGSIERLPQFLQARFARIYPAYLAVLLLCVPITIWCGNPLEDLHLTNAKDVVVSLASNVLMVQSLLPFKLFHYLDTPLWSVSAEMACYLAFPLFIWVILARAHSRAALWSVLVLCYLGGLVSFGLSALWTSAEYGRTPEFGFKVIYVVRFSPLTQIWQFLLGCCVARLYSRTGGFFSRKTTGSCCSDGAVSGALIALVLVLAVTAWRFGKNPVAQELGWSFLLTPSLTLLIFALAEGGGLFGAILGHRALVRLGEASYGLYILHVPLLVLFLHTLGNGRSLSAAWAAGAIGLTVCVSLGCYRYLEVPARHLLRPKPPSVGTALITVKTEARGTSKRAEPARVSA
jgi:peptidoglycan/LPS O-acetylase OafA/YrhL